MGYQNRQHRQHLPGATGAAGASGAAGAAGSAGAADAADAAGCPLIASSIDLVELLCEILAIRVEETPVEYKRLEYRKNTKSNAECNEKAKGEFVPMFYSNQEFLGVSITYTH